jgi:hypothetical protein
VILSVMKLPKIKEALPYVGTALGILTLSIGANACGGASTDSDAWGNAGRHSEPAGTLPRKEANGWLAYRKASGEPVEREPDGTIVERASGSVIYTHPNGDETIKDYRDGMTITLIERSATFVQVTPNHQDYFDWCKGENLAAVALRGGDYPACPDPSQAFSDSVANKLPDGAVEFIQISG